MTTLNVLLDTRRLKSGTRYPLKIRITHNKKSVYHSLGIDLLEKEWDKKKQRVRTNHQNHSKINMKVSTILGQLQEIVLDLEKRKRNYTASGIKSILTGEKLSHTVVNFWNNHIEMLRQSKRFGTARTFQDSLKKLLDFTEGADCQFEDIDFTFLSKFESYMRKNNLKVNSISVYLRSLKALFNRAIKEGLVDRSCYPFHDFHIKSERTPNRSMPVEEVQKLINYQYEPGCTKWRFRQFFLFSFAFMGMSFIDISFLNEANIANGRLIYRRRKTGRLYSIGLNEYNTRILKSFKEAGFTTNKFLLPILNDQVIDEEKLLKSSREVYSRCNKYLKIIAKEVGIDPSISTYYARYTWANIARKLGYSKDMIAEGLGHTYGNRITSIYLDDYDVAEIDEMNLAVLKYIFNPIVAP